MCCAGRNDSAEDKWENEANKMTATAVGSCYSDSVVSEAIRQEKV